MSAHCSINNERIPVGSTGNNNDGSGNFDRTPLLPIQNKCNIETQQRKIKRIDVDRRRKSRNGKLHQLLIRSPRSQRCWNGDENKSVTRSAIDASMASTSDRDPPPSPPVATPVRQNRYSTMMTIMDRYSLAASPNSAATARTPSTTESTASNSWTIQSARSFFTFFSHSDNQNHEFDGNHEEGLGWRCESDDEGSQSTMYRTDSLVSKLLRNELEQKNSSHDELDNDECKIITSNAFKFAFSWSAWGCVWILLFALSMSIKADGHQKDIEYGKSRESQWVNWDHIRYASSIFWTVGGDDYPGNDGSRISDQHRILTCLFMLGSLGFMGLALGNWGDSVIRTFEATLLRKDGGFENENYAQKHCSVERGPQSFRRHQKPARCRNERRNRPRHKTEGSAFNYGSLSSSSSKHNRHQWHDLSPLTFPDSSDDETEYRRLGKYDGDGDGSFIVFPRIHWLLVQSLALTTLSTICVAAIRYCEQIQYSDRTIEVILGSQVSLDNGQDEWNTISTLYYALSTATSAGLKNAIVPVSEDGKFLTLLFVPLSVITSLHWIVYIAQSRIQKSQQIRHGVKTHELEGGEGRVLVHERHRFEIDPSRKIVFVGNPKDKINVHNGISDDEDEFYHDNVVQTPVSAVSRKIESESSLEKFYEVELQRMGLVDIETFRVLKRKYKLQERGKLKEEADRK